MTTRRTLFQRLHDRLWTEVSGRLTKPNPLDVHCGGISAGSISGSHPWIDVCAALAEEKITSSGFRRLDAVRGIVETVGATDGRHYAGLIASWDQAALGHENFRRIDSWGGPIRWASMLLGTPTPCSPTTLRYLAHALWMKRQGYLSEGGAVVEIGVGYGGLAAMNSWISGARTHLVDLPDVVRAAGKMLVETGFREASAPNPPTGAYAVVSNYAFTELSATLQEEYFTRYLRDSACGVIVSNAAVFAKEIGGRQNADLISWFRREGLDARLLDSDAILCPSDHFHGNAVIVWE